MKSIHARPCNDFLMLRRVRKCLLYYYYYYCYCQYTWSWVQKVTTNDGIKMGNPPIGFLTSKAHIPLLLTCRRQSPRQVLSRKKSETKKVCWSHLRRDRSGRSATLNFRLFVADLSVNCCRRTSDRQTDRHTDAGEFIICPMLCYAIAMGQIMTIKVLYLPKTNSNYLVKLKLKLKLSSRYDTG